MNALYLEAVGLIAPGLAGWPASAAVLSGAQPWAAEPMPAAIATLLPANERRRTTATVKLALQVAQEATGWMNPTPSPSHPEASSIRTVLASSGGDNEIIDKICRTLSEPDRAVSPFHFHHSVHNTPAGYWAIATGCTQSSLSLAAFDGSFAAGLLEAAALAWAEAARVLLIAYDLPLPFPLSERRMIVAPFAVALLLNPEPVAGRRAVLRLSRSTTGAADRLDDPALERLRDGNPAARSLPLLCAIARRTARRVTLPAGESAFLNVEVAP